VLTSTPRYQGRIHMPYVINTNTAATSAANSLGKTNAALQKSLERLSSGNKVNSAVDDAGALAVSMKLGAQVVRTDAAINVLGNAISFLQTQDGAFDTVANIVTRMSELATLNTDPTKSQSDKDNYQTEFTVLKAQITNLLDSKFNGVDLFASGGGTARVVISEDGTQTFDISIADLEAATTAITGATNLSATTIATYTTALEGIAGLRAANGAQSNGLGVNIKQLETNRSNLEAALSRIRDTDVAKESTTLAKLNILNQAGVAMLAQANSAQQAALRLLN